MYRPIRIGTFIACALGELYSVGIYELTKSKLERYVSAVIKKAKTDFPDTDIVVQDNIYTDMDFLNKNLWTAEIRYYSEDHIFRVRISGSEFLNGVKAYRDEISPELLPAFQSVEAREALNIYGKIQTDSPMKLSSIKYIDLESSDLIKEHPSIDTRILFDYILDSEGIDLLRSHHRGKECKVSSPFLRYSTYTEINKNPIHGRYKVEIHFYFGADARSNDPNGLEREYIVCFYQAEVELDGLNRINLSSWLQNIDLLKNGRYIDIDLYDAIYYLIDNAYSHDEDLRNKRFNVHRVKVITYEVSDNETGKSYFVEFASGNEPAVIRQYGVYDPSERIDIQTHNTILNAVKKHIKDHQE